MYVPNVKTQQFHLSCPSSRNSTWDKQKKSKTLYIILKTLLSFNNQKSMDRCRIKVLSHFRPTKFDEHRIPISWGHASPTTTPKKEWTCSCVNKEEKKLQHTMEGSPVSANLGTSFYTTFSLDCCKWHFALGGQGSFWRIFGAGVKLSEQPGSRTSN